MSELMPPRFEPATVESDWIRRWEELRCFRPEAVLGDGRPYVIVIPPPNVTGILHMGHALVNTLQDVLVRFERLRGRKALWVPGTDHAGIATQNVVEKALAKEGKKRQDLGREAFLARTWEWKEKYGDHILGQLKRLGASCDFERGRFTMDAGLSRAVSHAFVTLWQEGLIFRGERLINWCPRCQTALSDEEAESRDEQSGFWHLRYPVAGEPGRYIVVATTRPETMLGDVAVAVHPEDERYRDLVGRELELPLTGRRIPVVADQHADPSKGSGAVKITPAHDFNDFAVAERQSLPRIRILDAAAKITAEAPAYAGLDRFDARKRVLADLEALGLLDKCEEKSVPLPRCYRCDTVVEPHLSKQWFVKMRPLLEPAAAAARDGSLRILPERYTRTYLDWVEQYRDWCISRQIWWGHRIPVWYDKDDAPFASVEAPAPGALHPVTGKPLVRQDEDVLDTWFSSQLWPFSVFGWPERTEDLAQFHPTDVLVTGREIIYFWVARMVMCALHFEGKLPFHTVYINGTILDSIGRRMSKSLGNGIDPIAMGEKYGMDAVRWTLVALTTEGQDIKLAESRFEGGRNFVNKLWNAARFVSMNLGEGRPALPARSALSAEDLWILGRLAQTSAAVTGALEEFRFADAARSLHEFAWSEFCDWYLELVKSRLTATEESAAADREVVRWVLLEVLDALTKLLSPIIPFATEEIRARLATWLPVAHGTVALERWPTADLASVDSDAVQCVQVLIRLVEAARAVRDRLNVPRGTEFDLVVKTREDAMTLRVEAVARRAEALGRVRRVVCGKDLARPPKSALFPVEGCDIFVPLEGVIDLDAESARLKGEIATVEQGLATIAKKLDNASFVERAPAAVVASEQARREALQLKLESLKASLADLG